MVGSGRTPVSLVCVFNDPDVRAACLDRSIAAGLAEAPETEFLPVDNTGGRYRSAGAALNAGARQARNDVVAFVHQDVYLHSLVALERAAARLRADPRVGLVGAVGITPSGAVAGVVRDRVVMIGRPAAGSTDVDSVDEVLFLVEREQVLREPLSEDPDLAWHAYAVEYGARVRSRGLRVVADDLVLTHNSMTTNLDRLAEAHHRVAALYPRLLPMRTTCGVIRDQRPAGPLRTAFRRRTGVATWWRESRSAARLARAAGVPVPEVVLGDVRLEIDEALDLVGASGLDVVNLGAPAADGAAWAVDGITRRGREVSATMLSPSRLTADRLDPRDGRALLVTGLDERTLASLAVPGRPHLLGLARDTGTWLLRHPRAPLARALWTRRRNAPFGRRGAPAGRPARDVRSATSATGSRDG